MMANKAELIKINNRKAAHSQHAHVLKQKRHGSGKGGWGDPMDDLKYLSRDPAQNPQDPNFEPESTTETQSLEISPEVAEAPGQESSDYFQNFKSDVESLSAFKIKVEELVNEYLYDKNEEKFTASLNDLNCPNFFNQVPKVLLWTVVGSKKQEHFPATRKLLMHMRATNIISKIQLESAFRRLFHRLNELSIINSNAYIILVDFGEYCVARNLMEDEFLSQLKKQTEFAKDPQRIDRLKKHVQEIIAEFFSSGDIDEAIRCVAEMDTPFYNHEVVKRIISTAFDHTNRERELTSQFLARAVGDNLYNENDTNYAIPRKNCELGFIILLQRVEDVPDVLELLSSFIGRAIVDEVLAPAFIENVDLLETDMGYAVIKHVKHLLSGPRHSDQLLNVWGTNSSKSIQSMKVAISSIIKEYLISRELDEALTAIQELNIAMFHHEIIKQLIPAVADYYVAKDLQQANNNNGADDEKSLKIREKLKIPAGIADKAIQIQLAIDLISTALQHNIMATEQVAGGFKRLKERLADYKLDAPLFDQYYECVVSQFEHIMVAKQEEDEIKEAVANYGGAKERKIDEEIEQIAKQSKDLVIEYVTKRNMDVKLDTFKAIQCKTQTVAGINYFVKIRINEKECIHVFIWRKVDQSMEVLGVELNKTEADELVFKKEEEKEVKKVKKKVGGLKDREIDDLVLQAVNILKDKVVAQNKDSKFTEYRAIKAKSQVVAGTNLFVKLKVDKNRCIHIRVWCKLDSTFELTNVEWNKSENDEILYF